MTTQSGNAPRTNRWSTPKRYACTHEDCPDKAVILNIHSRLERKGAHNCCNNHDHYANDEVVSRTAAQVAERYAGVLERLADS